MFAAAMWLILWRILIFYFSLVLNRFCIQPPCGQLNPVNNLVFGVLRSIYQHLQTLLPPDETIHMGGDEVGVEFVCENEWSPSNYYNVWFERSQVHLGCWNSSTEIVDYMIDHGLGREPEDFYKIWAEFHVNFN